MNVYDGTLPGTVAPGTPAGFFSEFPKFDRHRRHFLFSRAPLALSRLGGAHPKGQNRLASYRRPSGFG